LPINLAEQLHDQYGQNLNFAISADAVKTAIAKGLPENKQPSGGELAQEAFRRAWRKLDNKDYLGARMFFDMNLMLQTDSAKAYAGLGFADFAAERVQRLRQRFNQIYSA
jgi:hypothetical protein